MARVQTRRSVSVNRETYDKISTYCETTGISRASFVEQRINTFLNAAERLAKLASKEANEEVAKLAMTLPTGGSDGR